MTKPACFIIQPFDEGEFDDLYDDVIEIAVKDSGADCLRSDKILGAKPPFEKIKESIENAFVCIAEVTLDNPNVFFEAGWAFALEKPTFILWDKFKRTNGLPFDIHSKAGIPYNSQDKSWRKDLREKLTANIQHEMKASQINVKKKTLNHNNELSELDFLVLAVLFKTQTNNQRIGVTNVTELFTLFKYKSTETVFSFQKLLRLNLIERTYNTNGDDYCYYYILDYGIQRLEQYENRDIFLDMVPDRLENFSPDTWY
jgi:hypothetical protein